MVILKHEPEVFRTTFEECKTKLMNDEDIIEFEDVKRFIKENKKKFHKKGTATVCKVRHEGKVKILVIHPNPHDGRKLEKHFFTLKKKDESHDQRHLHILKPVY